MPKGFQIPAPQTHEFENEVGYPKMPYIQFSTNWFDYFAHYNYYKHDGKNQYLSVAWNGNLEFQ